MGMMDKKLSFTLSSYHFTIITIVAFLMILSVGVAVAELPYEKQIKFVSAIEQTNGHIIGAKENIVSGNYEIASLHLTYPTEELYDDFHVESKSNSQINQKIEYSLFILKHTDPNVDLDYFDKQTDEIIKILNDAKITLISEETLNDPVFKLDVIIDLLEMSKMEYQSSIESNDELQKIVDSEDSHAFAMMAENILYTINGMDKDKKNEIILKFQLAQLSILDNQSLSNITTQFDDIIDEIENIDKSGLVFQEILIIEEAGLIEKQDKYQDFIVFEQSSVPSWIKMNASWWADGIISDIEFLSGIEYLLDENIIQVSVISTTYDGETNNKIPSWIKNNASWWADGVVSDVEFLSGIEYMIERGILVV